MTKTLVCDWFMPHEDNTPVMVVITNATGSDIDLDKYPELHAAFFDKFAEDFGLDTEMPVSEYIYSVAIFDADVSAHIESWHHELRIELPL